MQARFVIVFRMTSLVSAVVSLLARCQGWRHCISNSVGCSSSSSSHNGFRFFCFDRGRFIPTPASPTSGHFFLLCPGSGYLACRCRCDGIGLGDVICGGGGGGGGAGDTSRRHVVDDVRSRAEERKRRSPVEVKFPGNVEFRFPRDVEVDSNGEVGERNNRTMTTTTTRQDDASGISSNLSTLGNRTSNRPSRTNNRPSITITIDDNEPQPTTTDVDNETTNATEINIRLTTESSLTKNVGDENTRMSVTGSRSERGQGQIESYEATKDDGSILKILMTSSYRKATPAVGTAQENYNHVTDQLYHVTTSRTDDVTLSEDARSDGWNDADAESAATSVNSSVVTSPDVIKALVSIDGVNPTTDVTTATAPSVTTATAVVANATERWTLRWWRSNNNNNNNNNGTREFFQADFRQVEPPDGAMTSSVLLYDDCVISGSAMAFVAMVFVLVSMVVVLNCYGRRWGDNVTHWRQRRTMTSPGSPGSRDLHDDDRTCPMMTPLARISDVHDNRQDKEA